jgi:NAD(P)-dependent dehydrogenase (short-subunit alcohol dehydrogenase family)
MVNKNIALVTGGNRGIGFEICRQLSLLGITVVLTSRNREKGLKAVEFLQSQGANVDFFQLDVTSEESIKKLLVYLKKMYNKLDILVNNAAIQIDSKPALNTETDVLRETIETNVYGPFTLIRELLPLLQQSNDGRIINFSSGLGAMNGMGGGYPAYRISKAAINAMTIIFAHELSGTNIRVNSMDPGWVRTKMGGTNAPRSVQKGAETAVWLATAEDVSTGKFYKDKMIIDW